MRHDACLPALLVSQLRYYQLKSLSTLIVRNRGEVDKSASLKTLPFTTPEYDVILGADIVYDADLVCFCPPPFFSSSIVVCFASDLCPHHFALILLCGLLLCLSFEHQVDKLMITLSEFVFKPSTCALFVLNSHRSFLFVNAVDIFIDAASDYFNIEQVLLPSINFCSLRLLMTLCFLFASPC